MNAVPEIIPPDVVHVPTPEPAMLADVRELATVSAALAITTPEQYRQAGEQLAALKKRKAAVEAERARLLAPLNAATKAIREFFERPLAWLNDAEATLKRGILTYQNELERQRKEAERVAAEAARKERERLEREAAAAREKARQAQEAAERKAAELEAAGRAEKAEAVRVAAEAKRMAAEQAAQVAQDVAAAIPAQPVVHLAAPKVAGQSTREVWKFRIKDESAIPREYMIIDEAGIGKVVRALKDRTNIPGVEVYFEKVLAASSR